MLHARSKAAVLAKASTATVDAPQPTVTRQHWVLETATVDAPLFGLPSANDGGDLCAGTRLGSYRVLELLGCGGMGGVYLAVDERLGREIALKVLHGHAGATAELSRLRREARVLAQLAHPHVVQVFEVGAADGRAYVAMEYVAGATALERALALADLAMLIGDEDRVRARAVAQRALDRAPKNLAGAPAKVLDDLRAWLREHPVRIGKRG